jgi:uncharacterized membrane protein YfhO
MFSFITYILILFIDKAYPFGNVCFLTDDAYVQYNNMLHMLIEWLSSSDKSAILWDKGLGVDVYQNMIYYCLSPFNIIAVILGEKHVELSLVLIIIIKASCLSVAALYFFEHTNKNNSEHEYGIVFMTLIKLVCSLSYGFCGYVLAYGQNIMWLDGMILLPVIAIAIERLVDEAYCKMYIICLGISFIFNFYYTFYICMFAVIYFLLECKGSLKNLGKLCVRFIIASVISAMLAGIVLVPAVYSVLHSASSLGGLYQAGLEQWGAVGEYIASFFPLKEITTGYLFNNNSFCGSVVIFMFVLFMASKITNIKDKIKYGITIVFLVVGLNWLKLNYVLHGLVVTHGMGNRFAIILTFILLVMAYRVLINIWNIRYKDVFISFGITVVIFVISLIDNRKMNVPWSYLIFAGLIIIYTMLFVLYRRKSIKTGTLIVWIFVTWTLEILGNVFYTMPDKTNEVSLAENISLSDWNDTYDNLDTNAGQRKTALVYNNYTPKSEVNWYSSMVNGNTIDAFKSMGMGHYDNVEYDYLGLTPLTALMFNVRYVLTNEYGTLGGYHLDKEESTYNLYEADDVAGLGFMLNKDIVNWSGQKDAAENQNDFATLGCGVDEELFTEVDLSNADEKSFGMEILNSEKGKYYLYRSLTNSSKPNVWLEFDADEDMELYLFSSDTRDQSVLVSVDDVRVVESKYMVTEFTSCIGEVKKGQHVKIILYGGAEYKKCAEKQIKLYSFNRDVFEQAKEKITSETLEFNGYDKNTFNGNITTENGGILYLAFPYNDGFTIKVDGVVTDKIKLGSGYMGVDITGGEHEITVEYRTPWLRSGICVSLVGLMICIIIMIKKRKRVLK